MKNREESRLADDVLQSQAEFPAVGTPINPLADGWMFAGGELLSDPGDSE
ncbi:MAG TPA: hypothetical protein VEZ13_00760 [Brevibacillus sp.]|nr:hypothetical protein [Brevibacillus sp.]